MRRQILRFPISKEFKKILEDDHEWFVLTDLRLKPLVMKRGAEGHIDSEVISSAYTELIQKYPKGRHHRVYNLHSHPRTSINAPSLSDIHKIFLHKINKPFGDIEAGYGIITRAGIYLIKLPEKNEKLDKLYGGFINQYYNKREEYNNLEKGSGTGPELVMAALNEPKTHMKAFKAVVSENPDIKTKMVRKTHRFNVGRRR